MLQTVTWLRNTTWATFLHVAECIFYFLLLKNKVVCKILLYETFWSYLYVFFKQNFDIEAWKTFVSVIIFVSFFPCLHMMYIMKSPYNIIEGNGINQGPKVFSHFVSARISEKNALRYLFGVFPSGVKNCLNYTETFLCSTKTVSIFVRSLLLSKWSKQRRQRV